jgi:hypothetical protein
LSYSTCGELEARAVVLYLSRNGGQGRRVTLYLCRTGGQGREVKCPVFVYSILGQDGYCSYICVELEVRVVELYQCIELETTVH